MDANFLPMIDYLTVLLFATNKDNYIRIYATTNKYTHKHTNRE